MIQEDDPIREHFAAIAHEMCEGLNDKGHRVTRAMSLDSSFCSGQARAGLRRDVLKEAASRAASQCGVDFRPMGEGLEFRTLGGDFIRRRYRLRSATRGRDGQIKIQHNSQSALTPTSAEYLAGADETWVLGVIFKNDEELKEIFLSRVIGVTDSRVPHLRLDSFIPLVRPLTPPDGFTPDEEDLDILDDDQNDEGDTAA